MLKYLVDFLYVITWSCCQCKKQSTLELLFRNDFFDDKVTLKNGLFMIMFVFWFFFFMFQVCAANFGEFCSIVGQEATEKLLVRVFKNSLT